MTDYANGFKDGFAAGLEEGKKIKERSYMDGYNDGLIEGMKKTLPTAYVPQETCPKCGITISGVMGYTCQSINCPKYYNTWTSPTLYNEWSAVPGTVWAASSSSQGAVGSTSLGAPAPGANGPPAGYEHNDLQGYDRVWMNGQWVEAGK